jgi:hypothetical protein
MLRGNCQWLQQNKLNTEISTQSNYKSNDFRVLFNARKEATMHDSKYEMVGTIMGAIVRVGFMLTIIVYLIAHW